MIDPDQKHFLSWRDRITGPFTMDEIEQQLRSRQINSLYKVQVNREWILLRELLGQLKREEAKLVAENAEQVALDRSVQAFSVQSQSSPARIPQIVPEESDFHEIVGTGFSEATLPDEHHDEVETEIPSRGFGITSFVLSQLFFVPFLNLICMLLAIVMGHLAFPRKSSPSRVGQPALPWIGVWTSYIYAGVLILMTVGVFTLEGNLRNVDYNLNLFIGIHIFMIYIGLSACVGAGLLMLAVYMMDSYIPKFHVCYVATLLPISIGWIIKLFLAYRGPFTSGEDLAIWGGVYLIMMIMQVLIWSWMIQDEKGKPLGYGHAAIASLFYTIISIFLAFAFLALMGMLNN